MAVFRLKYGEDPTGRGFYWPTSEQKRTELLNVKRLAPATFQSVYQCNPGAREGGIFLEEYFKGFRAPDGIELGIVHPNVRVFCGKGHSVVQAWDTAWDAKSTNDFSVCVTALLLPCSEYHRGESVEELGPCEPHFDVLILDVYRERLTWADLPVAFRRQHVKWQPEAIVIEKKQSGIGLYQTMEAAGLNVIGVTPQENKRARVLLGVGAGSVQGWFKLHRVLLAEGQTWVRPYKTELKDFTGDKSGKDDQVDATAHLVQYAIDLGSNTAMVPTDWTPERIDEIMAIPKAPGSFVEMMQVEQGGGQAAAFLSMIGSLQNDSIDVFADTCARCRHFGVDGFGEPRPQFCAIQQRRVAALESCTSFSPKSVH
jgi:predicted phage terminase large subunit-like protein